MRSLIIKTMETQEIELNGIFDKIENAITFYLMEIKVNKMEIWD